MSIYNYLLRSCKILQKTKTIFIFKNLRFFVMVFQVPKVFYQVCNTILCSCSPLPCNCYKISFSSAKHVQITQLIENVQQQLHVISQYKYCAPLEIWGFFVKPYLTYLQASSSAFCVIKYLLGIVVSWLQHQLQSRARQSAKVCYDTCSHYNSKNE